MSDIKVSDDTMVQVIAAAYTAYLLSCEESGRKPISKSDFYYKFQTIAPDFVDLVCGSSKN